MQWAYAVSPPRSVDRSMSARIYRFVYLSIYLYICLHNLSLSLSLYTYIYIYMCYTYTYMYVEMRPNWAAIAAKGMVVVFADSGKHPVRTSSAHPFTLNVTITLTIRHRHTQHDCDRKSSTCNMSYRICIHMCVLQFMFNSAATLQHDAPNRQWALAYTP